MGLSEIIQIIGFVGPILISIMLFTESIGLSAFFMGLGLHNLIIYIILRY